MLNNGEMLFKDILNIPNKYSVDSYIAKEKFIKNGNLNSVDKKIFKDFVRKIQWCYRFKDEEIGIQPYLKDNRRYGEVEIININLKDENLSMSSKEDEFLKQDNKIDRIIEIIFRLITFPQLILIQYKSYIRLFATHISVNLVDSSKRTIDDIISTNWIDTKKMNDFERKFFNNIKFDNFKYENIYEFYNSYVEEIIRYNGSLTAGEELELSTDRIKEINDEINMINKEIKKLRQELKRESQQRLIRSLNNEIRIKRIKINKLENELKEI